MCLSRPVPPAKLGPSRRLLPGLRVLAGQPAGRAWPSAPSLDLGAVARSDLRVRQLPGKCSRQAGLQTSFPAPTAAPAPGPPFPRALCSLAAL